MTIEEIITAVCDASNTTFEKAITKSRKMEYVAVRQRIAYFLYKHRKKLHITSKGIGELIGKDHATVISSHQKILDIIQYDKDERELINDIEKKIIQKPEEIILIDELRKITSCCWDDDTKEKLLNLLSKYDKGIYTKILD